MTHHRKLSKTVSAPLAWEEVHIVGLMPVAHRAYQEKHGRYIVIVTSDGGDCEGALHASISAKDQHKLSWREKYDIKNSLFGEEVEAFEFYPKASELCDLLNAYHIYVIPEGKRITFAEISD